MPDPLTTVDLNAEVRRVLQSGDAQGVARIRDALESYLNCRVREDRVVVPKKRVGADGTAPDGFAFDVLPFYEKDFAGPVDGRTKICDRLEAMQNKVVCPVLVRLIVEMLRLLPAEVVGRACFAAANGMRNFDWPDTTFIQFVDLARKQAAMVQVAQDARFSPYNAPEIP